RTAPKLGGRRGGPVQGGLVVTASCRSPPDFTGAERGAGLQGTERVSRGSNRVAPAPGHCGATSPSAPGASGAGGPAGRDAARRARRARGAGVASGGSGLAFSAPAGSGLDGSGLDGSGASSAGRTVGTVT